MELVKKRYFQGRRDRWFLESMTVVLDLTFSEYSSNGTAGDKGDW